MPVQDLTADPELDVEELVAVFKAVADPTRLRMLGLVADRPRCGQDLASHLGVSPPTVSHHLQVLRKAGLVDETREGPYRFYGLRIEALREAAKSLSDEERVQSFAGEDDLSAEERKVLRTFFDGSRLVAIPTQRKKKTMVFEEILRRLPRRKEYGERELSRFIETIHTDFCTIRREFVMGGYMDRADNRYWLTEKGRAVVGR